NVRVLAILTPEQIRRARAKNAVMKKSGVSGNKSPPLGSCFVRLFVMSLPRKQRTVQRLVDEHYTALYRYAYRLSGSGADAEDLTQEAFCKAQLNLTQLREPDRAKAWLFSILRNVYLHRLRTDRNDRCVSLDGIGDVTVPSPEPLPPVDPEQLQL